MADQSDLVRKISGLLAKAAGTDNKNEAAAFYEKAQELMLKYAVDDQALREHDGARRASERPVKADYMYSTNDSNAVGKKYLLSVVARACHVRMVDYSNSRGSNLARSGNEGVASQWCAPVGFATDVELAKLLYVSLLIQGARFGSADWARVAGRAAKGKSKFMTGYLVGFGGRVGERFRESEQRASEGSSALIVRRGGEVDEALREYFPRLSVGRRDRYDLAGASLGRQAGDCADLGQPRVGAGRPAIGAGH